MAETYILDWQNTAYGKQPKPQEVDAWLKERGYEPVGAPKVYPNGTVQVEVVSYEGLTAAWPEFQPPALTPTDVLGSHIRELLIARQDVMAIHENRRTPQERLLLAVTALVLYGYGVSLD
jgi:hypothetical protein